jgi:hypothetical protein
VADLEIDAMGQVAEALSGLEEDARGRVLRWAAERYGVTLAAPSQRAKDTARDSDNDEELGDEEIAEEAPQFEHFAELYDAAGPKTDVDRVLVAGYWLQAIQNQPQFQAYELTKELKNLGHNLSNVTESLTRNKERRPARVLQLRKSGSSQQARKTYKVTHEGLVFVQGMIAASA